MIPLCARAYIQSERKYVYIMKSCASKRLWFPKGIYLRIIENFIYQMLNVPYAYIGMNKYHNVFM